MRERLAAIPLSLCGLLLPFALAAQDPLRIGSISIRAEEVFDAEEESLGFVYRGANALHSVTKEGTIRRSLLFEEGDVYDPAVLAESERNLRALGLFRSVSVTSGEPHDGAVDVEVRTRDAWTVQINLSAGSGGGAMRGGVTLGERNFLGTATYVGIGFARDQDRTYRSIELLTPNFLRPYTTAHLRYATNSDGGEKVLELERPFYSTAAPWAAAVGVSDVRREEYLYEEGGSVLQAFGAEHLRLAASYGIALSSNDSNASRLRLGFEWREDTFRPAGAGPAETLPEDRHFRYVLLQYEALHADFLKWNYVNHDERYEDIAVGPSLSLRLGVSPRAFGVPKTTGLVGLRLGTGFRTGPRGFLQAAVAWESRIGRGLENSLLSASLLFVHRFDSAPRQTLVARIAGLRGWNLDRDVQIFADAGAGLRAYRLRAFEGDSRIILNVEHRIFSEWNLFHLLSPGLAIFVDAGLAGGHDHPIRFSSVKVDAGVGLRVAMAWAPVVNIFRLDVGYAFQRDPAGRRGWLISFSTGQAF
jgi:hypothetical protein